jgi:alcohol dehydrogenase
VGEVVEAGAPGLVGRRVVGEINLGCGACEWCGHALSRHCPARTVLGIIEHPGAFAEFLSLPERNLHVVPDALPAEIAAFVEPVAAACEILDQARLPCNCEIAVLGDGKLGLLIGQVLRAHGHRVRQFGKHPEKLKIAERAGAATEIAGGSMPTAAYDWVVEATGSPDGFKTAVQMTRPRGTIILKSTMHGMVPVDTAPVVVNEITLVGSRCGRFEPALELLERGVIDAGGMISERLPLSEAPRAFSRAAAAGVLKVQLFQ